MRTLAKAVALVIVVVAAFATATARAADPYEQVWKRGNEAYFRGDYAGAVAAYEELDARGIVSGDLAYNAGVTYFRLGQLGRAVWSFERALGLEPDDEDARFNLLQARKLLARRAMDKIEGAEREPTWIRVVNLLSPSAITWIFLGLYWATFVLLFLRRRAADESRATLGAGAALVGGAALLAGLMLFGRVVLDRIPFGIVLPDAVAVKEGADPNYRTSFELHAGLRVRLLERDQEWIRIQLANGLEGWVRDGDVGRL